VIATALDEAMTKVTAALGIFALTAGLEVEFLRPLPVGSRVDVFGRPTSRKGRVLRQESWLADQHGNVVARGTSTFVIPRREVAEKIVASLRAALKRRTSRNGSAR